MKSGLIALASHSVLWTLPLTAGGLHNVLELVAWAEALSVLAILAISFCVDVDLRREATVPVWRKALVRASIIGAIVWLAWWGYTALAMVALAGFGLALCRRALAKEDGKA